MTTYSSFGQSGSQKFEIKRGTNIAHWLSQSQRRGEERKQFFTEADVKKIASLGFDHIRLPIDEEQMWDENGNRHDEAFQLLEKAMEWCSTHNLRVVVDLHILRSHYFNAVEKPLWTEVSEQEKFFNLWRDLSKTLKRFPNSQVAYELMNEAVADDHESWNNLLNKAHAAIRELEPERTIVIGSNRWQSTNTFDVLRVPENDKNILLSFHFYEPFLLTHYGAKWTYFKGYEGPVHYPGIVLSDEEFNKLPENPVPELEEWVGVKFDSNEILKRWEKPLQKAKELGLPLYCGEFGVISEAPNEDTLRWYTDLINLLEEKNIGYANWNYKSDNFGLITSKGENQEMITIVTGN